MWRFRKSFSPLPGVRLTLSPTGLSTSVGIGPFRVTAGPRGQRFTARVPGTGLSYQTPLSGPAPRNVPAPISDDQAKFVTPATPQVQHIESAGSAVLTTPGLAEFRSLLGKARSQHADIIKELSHARDGERLAVGKYQRWRQGWLLRRIMKTQFATLQTEADEATARRVELEEQESQAKLSMQLEMPENIRSAFSRICEAFVQLAGSNRVWDTVSHRAINQFVERSLASRAIERTAVKFQLGECEVIQSDWNVPHLENANGGDLFLFPLFIVYFADEQNFALLEYQDVILEWGVMRFHEEEAIPIDSKTVGTTWAKTNKDGSPDRRFSANYQIPVVAYGKLVFRSQTGLNEEYMVSNVENCLTFGRMWDALVKDLSGERQHFEATEDGDELYDRAVAIVTRTRRASIIGVQRSLNCGYNRAARLVEMMEAQGIVSAPQHNGNREVIAPPPPEL